MDVREIVHESKNILRMAGWKKMAHEMPEHVWNSFAGAINKEIASHPENARFRQLGGNKFEVVSYETYDGGFKTMLDELKDARRKLSAKAGEIRDVASILPKAVQVRPPKPPKPPALAETKPETSTPSSLTAAEDESIQRLCQVIEARIGFEQALIVNAACRSGDNSKAEAAIEHMFTKI